jgi:hypothetical protein
MAKESTSLLQTFDGGFNQNELSEYLNFIRKGKKMDYMK